MKAFRIWKQVKVRISNKQNCLYIVYVPYPVPVLNAVTNIFRFVLYSSSSKESIFFSSLIFLVQETGTQKLKHFVKENMY